MMRSGLRSVQIEPVLIVMFTGALGLVWWCSGILVAGDAGLAVFCPGTAVSVAILASLAPRRIASISLPMGIVPLLSAPWTTPTGDNDGLWVMIFPTLIFWIFALFVLALGVRLLLKRLREGQDSASVRRPWVLGGEVLVVALAVVVAGWLQNVVVAGPWSDLRTQVSTYPVPAGFTSVGWQREGSSRCSDVGCRPQLGRKMRSTLDVDSACQTLKKSLQDWSGTSAVSDDEPIDAPESGYWEKCAYITSQGGAGVTREVQAVVEAPSGRAPEVIVSVLSDCMLTC